MASRFWVGGAGTWDGTTTTHWSATTGGAGGASVPTSADDVFFDASSGGGAIATTGAGAMNCRNFDTTGFTGSFTGGGTINTTSTTTTVTVGAGTTLTSVSLSINSSTAVTCALTCNGKSFSNITVASAGTLSQQDAMGVTGVLTLTFGAWLTNNFASTIGSFASQNTNTRTLTMGSSSITCTGSSATIWNTATLTGMTITANTATITLTGAAAIFNGGGSAGYSGTSLVLSGSGSAGVQGGNTTFASLIRTGTAAKTDSFTISVNITVTGTLTLNSNSSVNRLVVQSITVGTQRTITAAAVVISNTVDFQDIAGAGAATWTVAGTGATALGDCGGNSGITFTAPATQTHTASAGGNWSDATKWTSRVPLPQDNVVVDVNTTGTLTADMPRLGANVDFTGFAGTAAFNSAFNTGYGNWTFSSGMTVSGVQSLILSGRGAQTITSNGKQFSQSVTIGGPGGTYTLQDALNTVSTLQFLAGTLASVGLSIQCAILSTSGVIAKTFASGGSTVTLTATTSPSTTLVSIAAGANNTVTGAPNFVIANATTSARTFAAGGFTYGTLTYTVANSPGALIIGGANTWAALNIGPGRAVQFAGNTLHTTAAWTGSGAPNGYLYLPGVAGNYASAPDSAALSITGDITLDCKAALDTWTPAAEQSLINKWNSTGNQGSYALRVTATGALILYLSSTGANSASATSTATLGLGAAAVTWVRVTWRASDGRVQFFTSADGITWTQLGANVTLNTVASIFDSTSFLFMGTMSDATKVLAGKLYNVRVYSDITQTTKVFDADFTSKTVGANTFVESSTNAATVTINGTLAQVGDGRLALSSTTGGVQGTLAFTGADLVNADYLTVQDLIGSPAATWYAGTHSVDLGNNSGWTFTAGARAVMALGLLMSAAAIAPIAPTAAMSLAASAAASVSAASSASLSLVASAFASAPALPSASVNLALSAAPVAPVAMSAALALALSAVAAAPIGPTEALSLVLSSAAQAPITPSAALNLLLVAAASAPATPSPQLDLLLTANAGLLTSATVQLSLVETVLAAARLPGASAQLDLSILSVLAIIEMAFDFSLVKASLGFRADDPEVGFIASPPMAGFRVADTALGR